MVKRMLPTIAYDEVSSTYENHKSDCIYKCSSLRASVMWADELSCQVADSESSLARESSYDKKRQLSELPVASGQSASIGEKPSY